MNAPETLLVMGATPAIAPVIAAARGLGVEVLGVVDVEEGERLAAARPVRGVVAEGSDGVAVAAELASRLGVVGPTQAAARNLATRARLLACLAHAGLRTPAWGEVRSPGDAARAAELLGLPLVVRGVGAIAAPVRVETPELLAAAVDGALAASPVRTALLEQALDGASQRVGLLLAADGVRHRVHVVDRLWASDAGRTHEVGQVSPSGLDPHDRDRLGVLAERAAAVLGVAVGPFTLDVVWTGEGPRVADASVALGDLVGPETSDGPLRAAVAIALGRPIVRADLAGDAAGWALLRAWPEPGRVTRVAGIEAARALPGVRAVVVRPVVGDTVARAGEGAPPVTVVASGDGRIEALARVRAAVRTIRIDTGGARHDRPLRRDRHPG